MKTYNYNNNDASKRYKESVSYEKEVLYNSRVCSICGSTDFKIMEGNIVCQKCGLCQEIFCNTVYGFEEFTPDIFEDSFVQALQELNNDGDNSE